VNRSSFSDPHDSTEHLLIKEQNDRRAVLIRYLEPCYCAGPEPKFPSTKNQQVLSTTSPSTRGRRREGVHRLEADDDAERAGSRMMCLIVLRHYSCCVH
jgi:hypothetical protein